jgi:hypothetical protein
MTDQPTKLRRFTEDGIEIYLKIDTFEVPMEDQPTEDRNALLRRVTDNGIEVYLNIDTNESSVSKEGYCRLANVDSQTINERLGSSLEDEDVLLSEGFIAQWLPQDNPELTHEILTYGIRVYMHESAGFTVGSEL